VSKRFGRNQRRKLREELNLAIEISAMNAQAVEDAREVINRTAMECTRLRSALTRARAEIYQMVQLAVKPELIVEPAREGRTVSMDARMGGNHNRVYAALQSDLEVFYMLRGPEAQAALIENLVKQLTNELLRKAYIR